MTEVYTGSFKMIDGRWTILHSEIREVDIPRQYVQDTFTWLPYPDVGYFATVGYDADGRDFLASHVTEYWEAHNV